MINEPGNLPSCRSSEVGLTFRAGIKSSRETTVVGSSCCEFSVAEMSFYLSDLDDRALGKNHDKTNPSVVPGGSRRHIHNFCAG